MDRLTGTRWTRYGHDRLYVQTADGTRLGYWDHETGRLVLEPCADEQTSSCACAAWRCRDQPP